VCTHPHTHTHTHTHTHEAHPVHGTQKGRSRLLPPRASAGTKHVRSTTSSTLEPRLVTGCGRVGLATTRGGGSARGSGSTARSGRSNPFLCLVDALPCFCRFPCMALLQHLLQPCAGLLGLLHHVSLLGRQRRRCGEVRHLAPLSPPRGTSCGVGASADRDTERGASVRAQE